MDSEFPTVCRAFEDVTPPGPELWKHAGLQPMYDFIINAIAKGAYEPDPIIPVQLEPCPFIAGVARQRYLASVKNTVG